MGGTFVIQEGRSTGQNGGVGCGVGGIQRQERAGASACGVCCVSAAVSCYYKPDVSSVAHINAVWAVQSRVKLTSYNTALGSHSKKTQGFTLRKCLFFYVSGFCLSSVSVQLD